eukprot:scaffold451192_cov35-Prasinocladus_malaysianus.AAC.2
MVLVRVDENATFDTIVTTRTSTSQQLTVPTVRVEARYGGTLFARYGTVPGMDYGYSKLYSYS